MQTTHDSAAGQIVLLLGIGTAISLLGDSTLYTVLPRLDIAAEAGVTLAMVGVLLAANRVIRLLTNGLAGVLYDRLPRRRLLVASLFAGALSTFIFALGRGPVPLLASRLLWGAAWSGIWVGGNAIVLDVSPPQSRGRLSGHYQMWFFLGTGGAALVGGVLTDLIGFRQALLAGGILTTLAGLLWLVALPRLDAHTLAHASTSVIPQPGPFPWGAALAAAVPLFMTRFVFAGVVAATLALWLNRLVGTGLPVVGIVVPLGSLTGVFVAVRALVSLGGARLAGSASDMGRGRWLTAAVVMLVGALGTWISASPALELALVGALLASITAGGVQAIVPAIAGDSSRPEERGRVLSIAYTLGDLGSAFGPPLALGLVATLTIESIYRGCAVLLALTVLFALWQSGREVQNGAIAQRP